MSNGMGVYLLHYREADGRRQAFVNHIGALYGLFGLTIDLSGNDMGDFTSIREALADERFAGHTWCWLDPSGTQALSAYEHPTADVVYCLGDDAQGFEGLTIEEMPGARLFFPPAGAEEWRASVIAAALGYDRFLSLNGGR